MLFLYLTRCGDYNHLWQQFQSWEYSCIEMIFSSCVYSTIWIMPCGHLTVLHEMVVPISWSPQHSWWGLVLAWVCSAQWATHLGLLFFFFKEIWFIDCSWMNCNRVPIKMKCILRNINNMISLFCGRWQSLGYIAYVWFLMWLAVCIELCDCGMKSNKLKNIVIDIITIVFM